jgi:CDP-diacylglycerol--serine O-phosphatidyltransferase
LFTLANLFMGFTAIVHISNSDFIGGALFILLAAVFDSLDGAVARLVRSTSEFGAELDSLCDAVSFGVAPSFMAYKAFFSQYGEIGILLSSLPALAGVVRLARFNVNMVGFEDKKFFTGLPIPSGALTVVSYIIFYHITTNIPDEYKPVLMFAVVIMSSLAMVSTVKYHNMPRPTLRGFKQNPVILIIFILGVIACFVTRGEFIFPFMMIYIVGDAIRHFVIWLKKTYDAPDEIEADELEPDEFDDDTY